MLKRNTGARTRSSASGNPRSKMNADVADGWKDLKDNSTCGSALGPGPVTKAGVYRAPTDVDCGGKRSATPLSLTASGPASSIHPDSSQSGVALRLPPQS